MSEQEIKFQAMEKHYLEIIDKLTNENKLLKEKLHDLTLESKPSAFEETLKMRGYELLNK